MIKHDIATHQSNLIMFVTIHSIHHHHPIQSLLLLYPHHHLFFSLSPPPPPNSFSPPSTSSPTMHPLLLRHNMELMRKTHICIHGGKKETGHVSIKMLMHMLSS